MRFAELSLERYGRFSDCRLDFRPGPPEVPAPDLHLIYGANETGKSTTLAAVSDLLFGFGASTPYNFRFPYPQLRVGAVLEEGKERLACRRRKGRAESLVDAAEEPIDDAALHAMLRGQTRDSFHAGFSMDQERLRKGGRAIVEMQDELGKALFAATSGLVGISDVMKALNSEADGIWGQRASGRRSHTVAERQYREAEKRIRDFQTKPKDWEDARRLLETRTGELASLEARRDAGAADLRRLERLRRTGPAVRRRAALMEELEAHRSAPVLSVSEEVSAQALLAELGQAQRDGDTARQVLDGLDADAALLAPDTAVLAEQTRIDRLAGDVAAIGKAARDSVGLEADLAAARIMQADQLSGFGSGLEAQLPSRISVAELRDLAQGYSGAEKARLSRQRDLDGLEERCAPLRLLVADAVLTEDLPHLVSAVDAARTLGAGYDEHCAEQLHRASRALTAAHAAIARLAPWTGEPTSLACLPTVSDDEIDAGRSRLAQAEERSQSAATEITRLEQELAALDLEAADLSASGLAVSAAEVEAARATRDAQWRAVRGHVTGGVRIADPAAAASGLDRALQAADALADRRFSLAEASGRLAGIDFSRAKMALSLGQERSTLALASGLADSLRQDWSRRLQADGLPDLEPLRLRAWFVLRAEALGLAETAAGQARQATLDLDRRAQHCRSLSGWHGETDQPLLAPLLEHADRLRQQGEARSAAFTADRTRLRDLEDQAASLRRQVEQEAQTRDRLADVWASRIPPLGLTLRIDAALPRLELYEQLRARADSIGDLQHRLDGIARDAGLFAAEVAEVAGRVCPDLVTSGVGSLAMLTARLATARATAQQLGVLTRQQDLRRSETVLAAARVRSVLAALAPVLARAGGLEPTELGTCIEGSQRVRRLREELAGCERDILAQGDGHALLDLVEAWNDQDPDRIASDAQSRGGEQETLNVRISEVAGQEGAARKVFDGFGGDAQAADSASDVSQARAEMDTLAEDYLLRRTQFLMLGWIVENTRKQRQNPLLVRAGALFSTLTLGRYVGLHIEHEDRPRPQLMVMGRNGEIMVGMDALSEGTTDQLFLALRLAAVEQSVAAGVRLPFLADDLFVNFDEDRSRAGFQALAELARSTQVLFFTHHAHLVPIARDVVGADVVSTCELEGD